MLPVWSLDEVFGPAGGAVSPAWAFSEVPARLLSRMPGLERQPGPLDEPLWFFLAMTPLLALALAQLLNPRALRSVELATQVRDTDSPFADQSAYRNLGVINVAMILALIVGGSLLISAMERQFKLIDVVTHAGLMIAWLLGQVLIILLLGFLFYNSRQVSRQFLLINAHLRLLGAFLGVSAMIVLYGIHPQARDQVAEVVLSLAVGLFFLGKGLVLRNLMVHSPFQITYHIMYLCAVEIAPLLIFIQVFF